MKFRQQAIDYYSRQDRHHYPLKVLSKKTWLLFLLVLAIMVAAGVWLVLGSVKTQVFGKGLLITQEGAIYSVASPVDGAQVDTVRVTPGAHVQKGQTLVELKSPSLEHDIKASQDYIEVLQNEMKHLNQQAEAALEEQNQMLAQKETMIKKVISIEEENIKSLGELSKKYNDLLARGLSTQRDTTAILNDLNTSKQKLEQSYQSLVEIDLNKKQNRQVWDERIRDLNLKIENERYRLNQLKEKTKLSATLTSPIDGIILNLQASPGDLVGEGKPIVTLSNLGKGLDMIAFFPPDEGKKIKVGMRALVTPLTVKPEEFGNMIGTVLKVSPFPANDQVMMSILKNENLVRSFAQENAPLMVTVRIQEDANTPTGFAWTTSQGPQEAITPGTVSDVKVVIKRQAPWTLLLPTFKKLLGSEG